MTDARVHGVRYRRILRFAAGQLVLLWWFDLVFPRIGLAALAERTRAARMRRLAERFHALAVELGGLMIKVGQFLSTRVDVLPPEVTRELEGLQDEVPPVPFAQLRALAESELGMPIARAFAAFDEVPVAAASLGQAHRARLTAVDAVETGIGTAIVKVQRPGIDDVVTTDLAALRRVSAWISRVRFVADRVDAPALVEEFARTCREEIDYLHEATSAERFAAAFSSDPRVSVPEVVWERTSRRVLTLSDVTAIKITDREGLRAAGIDPSEVATVFAEVMLDQVFTHGFFHADPHPGNIFVTPRAAGTEGPAWRLTFIDFGMMGEVPASLRAGLRSFVIAVAARDSRGLVAAARQTGVLLPTADTARLQEALSALFDRFGGMGFAQLRTVDPREFEDFAVQFGDLVRTMPVQLPEGLLLLFRAVSLTSGMCSALDPAFNIWDAVEPYANRLLRDQGGDVMKDVMQQAVSSAGVLWRMPPRIDSLISRMDAGTVSFDTSRIERRVDRIEHLVRRILSVAVFAVVLIAGVLLLSTNAVLGIVFMSVSALPLLHALFAGMFRRR